MPSPEVLAPGKKIYFASDFHFGIPDYEATRARERKVCAWLDLISADAQQIYLLGDLFDSWMEYKRVVPKGSIRFLAKLAELVERGIDIIIFTGNHDLWVYDYFQKEIGARVYTNPQDFSLGGKVFHLGHGDGVVKEEWRYKAMKDLFRHPVSRWIYRQIHPDLGLRMADFFSRLGPKHKYVDLQMKEADKEYQVLYAHRVLQKRQVDYFIFGHRHIPCQLKLNEVATFINLGDWISYDTYAVFDGRDSHLMKY